MKSKEITKKQLEQIVCPGCCSPFVPERANKKFCSDRCRKNSSQKLSRQLSPVNSQNSPSKRRVNMVLLDTAFRLAEGLYTKPSNQRLGYMKMLIDDARAGNSMLRQILSNKYLLKPPRGQRKLFHRKCPESYYTIAQAADRYCRRFWNAGVKAVVYGIAPEPPTGEVL